MMDNSYYWLFQIPTLLMVVFCIGAMMYVASRSSKHGRPKAYAIAALALILLGQLIVPVSFSILSRRANVDDMAMLSGVVSLLFTMVMIFSLGLLIVAAFIDRQAPSNSSAWDAGGTPLAENPSDNPYASPRQ